MPHDLASLRLASEASELERLYLIIEDFGKANGIPAEAIFQINLTLEEIVSNCIKYGYQGEPGHTIDLTISFNSGTVTIIIEDAGLPFNLLDVPPPNLHCDVEDRPIGGLGVHLARTLMDALEYKRREGKNVLCLKKRVAV
jgi:serine/threonine-protein kinase RsbW